MTVYPRPVQDPLPLWIAIGGNPNSIRRAGQLGIPVAIAAIGRAPENFVPMVQLYREAGAEAGHDPGALQLSVTCHYHIGETPERAASEFWPPYTVFDQRSLPSAVFRP